MLPAYWPVCKFDLILPVLFLAFNVLTTITAYHLPLYQCVAITFNLPNPHCFCKIHCSLSCAMLPCALAKYLVNRMAYDESTAWFRVQHCLKPLKKTSLMLCLHCGYVFTPETFFTWH